MLQVYICDDMLLMRKRYHLLITEIAHKNHLSINIKQFATGEELLFDIETHPNHPDIIYLDVYMGKLTGIETGKRLREMECHSEIIFLTSSETDVFEAFDVNPLYYVIKDKTSLEKFGEIFLKAVKIADNKEHRFFACASGRVHKHIAVNNIYYFEVKNRIVTVHYGDNETFDFYSSMEKLLLALDNKCFLRCHRSFIANQRAIEQASSTQLTLINGAVLPVGATYARELRTIFEDDPIMQLLGC